MGLIPILNVVVLDPKTFCCCDTPKLSCCSSLPFPFPSPLPLLSGKTDPKETLHSLDCLYALIVSGVNSYILDPSIGSDTARVDVIGDGPNNDCDVGTPNKYSGGVI